MSNTHTNNRYRGWNGHTSGKYGPSIRPNSVTKLTYVNFATFKLIRR